MGKQLPPRYHERPQLTEQENDHSFDRGAQDVEEQLAEGSAVPYRHVQRLIHVPHVLQRAPHDNIRASNTGG